MIPIDEIVEERIAWNVTARHLTGILAYPDGDQPEWCLLICGPHPLLGGNESNNVVAALRRTVARAAGVALSFEYGPSRRGVAGARPWADMMSEFWRDQRIPEETDWASDGQSAFEFLCGCCVAPIVVAGYSFGCWVAAQLAGREGACGAVFISPNPTVHDFAALRTSDLPLHVIHSDNDFACGNAATVAWFDGVRPPKSRLVMPAAEHFFRGQEEELACAVVSFAAACPNRGAGSGVDDG